MDERRRHATLGLWCIPGVGVRSLAAIERQLGDVGAVLELPPRRWLQDVALRPAARAAIATVTSLAGLADRAARAAAACDSFVAHRGDEAYPPSLVGLRDAPPLLFVRGIGAGRGARLRVGMVGTRRPEGGFEGPATQLARGVAERGVGIVSGAADGVDRWCHEAAMSVGGETWAFLGAGLGRLAAAQVGLVQAIVGAGGTLFSEYPPWVRATRFTFLQRNRLIAAASDAVLILRAPRRSGALETARCALAYGRPLLALPGDPFNPAAEGCNRLLQRGAAAACLGVEDLLAAARRTAGEPPQLQASSGAWSEPWSGPRTLEARAELWDPPSIDQRGQDLSPAARAVFERLVDGSQDFDVLHAALSPRGHDVGAALTELELAGAIERLGGGRFRVDARGVAEPRARRERRSAQALSC